MSAPTLDPASPRLSALRDSLATGSVGALDAFWHHVEREGTPIVEAFAGDPEQALVTFVWREAEESVRNVILEGGLGVSRDPLDRAMTRLPGSDVWFRTYLVGRDLRLHYRISPNDSLDTEDWRSRRRTQIADPLNPRSFVWPSNTANPEAEETRYSIVELDAAPRQPWVDERPGIPRGVVEERTIRSDALSNERRVWFYRPAGYSTAGPRYQVAVLLDGWEWAVAMPVAPTLDNLIAANAIPPTVVVMPESLDYRTRGVEYPCHDPFAAFLADELLPSVWEQHHASEDPSRTIVAGQSFGGIAATFAALRRPETFGNVISQSGSFWWREGWEMLDPSTLQVGGALIDLVTSRPSVPVRFYLEVGTFEYVEDIVSNASMRAALRSMGYDVTYRQYEGGHHWLDWRGSLAEALVLLSADRREVA